MDYRNRLAVAVLAAVTAGFGMAAGRASAATVAVEDGIAVKTSELATPTRGMSMEQVASKFGVPTTKIAPVGRPPIARWEYPGFVVFFEHEHVIHSVVANS